MLCLGGEDREDYGGVLKLLDVLLSPEAGIAEKRQILQNDFDIPMTETLEAEVQTMVDMEIVVDHIASMQIDNLNYDMGTARSIAQKQYHPDENELFYRTAELGKIPADEYVSSVLRDDLTGILRDIREAHPKKIEDGPDVSPFAAIEEFQKRFRLSSKERGVPRNGQQRYIWPHLESIMTV